MIILSPTGGGMAFFEFFVGEGLSLPGCRGPCFSPRVCPLSRKIKPQTETPTEQEYQKNAEESRLSGTLPNICIYSLNNNLTNSYWLYNI